MEKNMDKAIYKSNALSMIELVICSINGEIPSSDFLKTLDFDQLFEVCQKHILTACTAYALESAGIKNERFSLAKEKAIRKNILFDAERKKILQLLEQENIWYMPLKGAVLKDWYPKLGMRQMSDNDILYDGAYQHRVKEIMLALGFSCEHFGIGKDDAYFKPPVFNFEMHKELFTVEHVGKLYAYYISIKQKLIKDTANTSGFHFRTEDFYIYMIAHEYRHYQTGGTGIRSLIDIYVFLKKWNNTLDWEYIRSELQTLEILSYEQKSRELTMKLFNRQELTEEEANYLDYYIFSGIYGNLENKVKHEVERYGNGSKAKYILRRIFPTMEQIQVRWNFFYRHKWLIPILWIYRPFHGLLKNHHKLKEEVKHLKNSK